MKLIATDMDGTLLNDERKISKENAEAIKAAQQDGIHVVVATGRDFKEASMPLKEAGLTCPILCVNGAEERSANGELIHAVSLAKNEALTILDILTAADVYFEVYTNRGAFTDDYEKGLEIVIDVLQSAGSDDSYEKMREIAKHRFESGAVQLTEDYTKLIDSTAVYKFLAFSRDETKRQAAKDDLEKKDVFSVSASASDNLEITHWQAQKGIALRRLAERLGINSDNVMAIGDNLNDVSMLKYAGTAVAMENGEAEVKQLADFVTASNEDNGVAKAINKWLK